MRKGQLEMVVILGLVVVAAVTIYLTLRETGPVYETNLPKAVQQKQSVIRKELQDFLTERARKALELFKKQSGFSAPKQYWFTGGKENIPDPRESFQQLLAKEIAAAKGSLRSVGTYPLTFTNITVKSVSLNQGNLLIILEFPTIYDKTYLLSSSYEIRVPTSAGRAFAFAEQFAKDEAHDRFLEYATLYEMTQVREGNEGKLPFFVTLDECGQELTIAWDDLAPFMGKAMGAMKANASELVMQRDALAEYRPLGPAISVDFSLDRAHFGFAPDPIHLETEPEFSALCVTDPVDVGYMVRYPLTVRVPDALAKGSDFAFSLEVFVNNSAPGGSP